MQARAQAEADERAQKLAAEVARAATAARLAADANSNLAVSSWCLLRHASGSAWGQHGLRQHRAVPT